MCYVFIVASLIPSDGSYTILTIKNIVSRPSTNVSPSLNHSLYVFETGSNSSCPHACSLYPNNPVLFI